MPPRESTHPILCSSNVVSKLLVSKETPSSALGLVVMRFVGSDGLSGRTIASAVIGRNLSF